MEQIILKLIEIVENTESFDLRFFVVLTLSFIFVVLLHKDARISMIAFMKRLYDIIGGNSDIYLNGAALFLNEKTYLKQIENIDFSDADKNYVYRLILNIKTIVVIKETKIFVEQYKKKYSKFTKEALVAFLTAQIFEIEDKYEKKILEELIKKYGKIKGEKLYYYVYDNRFGKQGFKQYHEENIKFIILTLDGLVHTPIKNCKFIIFSYLNAINVALSRAITDLYKVFVNFNGDLNRILTED